MTVKIVNETPFNIDIWINIVGGVKYWDNNVDPGREMEHHPGYVWYDLNAKVNTGSDNEISTWGAVVQGILPFWALPGAILTTLAKTGIIRQGALPDSVKKLLDDEAIEYVQGVEYKAAEWTNIYGTDKKFVVRGGDIEWEEKDGKIVVKSVSPLSLDKVEG